MKVDVLRTQKGYAKVSVASFVRCDTSSSSARFGCGYGPIEIFCFCKRMHYIVM